MKKNAVVRPAVYFKMVAVASCWGGTFIAGRVLALAMPPLVAAAGRFVVAAALLLLLAWQREGGLPRLSGRQVLATLLLGATGVFLYNLFFFGALARLPASRTALIIALNPIVTALAMALLLRERLGFTRWAGVLLALCGSAVVITRGDLSAALSESIGAGELLMFGGVCSWAAYTIVGRRALQGLSPIAATTYAALWGGLLLCLGAAWQWTDLRPEALGLGSALAIGYLAVFGTVLGFVWYYEGVKALGPARAAVFNNLVPVFGVALAAVLLGEQILLSMLLGGALVIAGVMLTNR
jgi:drug/metabolite transporter (DMT)-like permease